jgi:glycosyltransferase involved in cell wall biosynthesis
MRPTLLGRVRMVLHLLVRGVACALLRRRPLRRADQVTFLLGNAYGIGGTTRTCLNLAGELAHTRRVEVISLIREHTEPAFPFADDLTVTALVDRRQGRGGLLDRLPSILMLPIDHRMQRWASLRTDIALLRALWRTHAGVLIGTRPAFNVLVARLGRPGLRTVGQEHINLDTHKPRMRAELLAAYTRMDVVAALTDHDRDRLAHALGPRVRVVSVPNAVPLIDGEIADPANREIVAVGRLARQKGFDMLIDAFSAVAPFAPGWRLRICGGGEMRQQLERQIAVSAVADRICLTGPVRDVGNHLAKGSIYALSSRFEGLPLALLEAMSKGLAIVAFECPTGPAEVIDDGATGILVPSEDVDALAAALLRLTSDEAERRRLADAARRRADDFSIEAIGRRWQELLADLEGSEC